MDSSNVNKSILKRAPSMGSNSDDGDNNSVSSGDSNTGTDFSNNHHNPQEQVDDEADAIAQSESSAVNCIKAVVAFVLLFSTFLVGTAVFFYIKGNEQEELKKAFDDGSLKILSGIGLSTQALLSSTEEFAISLVAAAKSRGSEWPFCTMDDFAIQAYKFSKIINSDAVTVMPLVSTEQRPAWEEYTSKNLAWINESLAIQSTEPTWQTDTNSNTNTNTSSTINNDLSGGDDWQEYNYIHVDGGTPLNASTTGPYFPEWQTSPVLGGDLPIYNHDAYSGDQTKEAFVDILQNRNVIFKLIPNIHSNGDPESLSPERLAELKTLDIDVHEPYSNMYYPILANNVDAISINENKGNLVGVLSITVAFSDVLKNVLPPGVNNFAVVFASECGHYYEYRVNGPRAVFIGGSNKSNGGYDTNPSLHSSEKRVKMQNLKDFSLAGRPYTGLPISGTYCPSYVSLYPSSEMEDEFMSRDPITFCLASVFIFMFTALVFIIYDRLVERRQQKVMLSALRSNAIVSSLFPSTVRNQLYSNKDQEDEKAESYNIFSGNKQRMNGYMTKNVDKKMNDLPFNSAPIAELYPESTVMFADISGFTAWSSTREASEVFILLENIYGAFDKTAKKRGVFKVETIGDSYVAVCGLPEPRKDHAVVMARFARDCHLHMQEVTRKLEVKLGPDTADLTIRVGLNSGPVTAGVLRGDRSRFQLFGDTVNTASRMESTGIRSKIHVSGTTAALLQNAGKQHWITPREDLVTAKGKGSMQTYWVEPQVRAASTTSFSSSKESGEDGPVLAVQKFDEKSNRMVEWNVDILTRVLKQVVAHREATRVSMNKRSTSVSVGRKASANRSGATTTTPLEEFSEIIEMPAFDKNANHEEIKADNVELSTEVVQQLRQYVAAIASMYRDNSFHNFEHASHVTMSIVKLLRRVVTPKDIVATMGKDAKNCAASLHQFTYGLTSDPLTQFACIFSGLIHDVDHQGVSNNQLVAEKSQLALVYHERSVAEQNSVDLAWQMLFCADFDALRNTVCSTSDEQTRFRQLVVNIVMATDIMDKDLNALRNERWKAAFASVDSNSSVGSGSGSGSNNTMGKSDNNHQMNLKATIIIEHMIQASDVSHTMQHWQIYRKWNERLFMEMYKAYHAGRGGEKDPASFWYKGEIGFFDFYILPLAGKLRDCGVFGVSSDEYLTYANKNREEWIEKGQQVVAEMVERYNKGQIK